MRRSFSLALLLVWVSTLVLPLALPAEAAPALDSARQAGALLPVTTPEPQAPTEMPPLGTQTPTDTPAMAEVHELMNRMTVADKVGQLFLLTFMGSDVTENSDIATLVRDYRVGGVVLLPENDNYRNTPMPGLNGAQGNLLDTPQQIADLAAQLQNLAMSPARPVSVSQTVTPTVAVTATATISAEATATAIALGSTESRKTAPEHAILTPTPTAFVAGGSSGTSIPLLIGLDWTGDGTSTFGGSSGFTVMPSEMALGATWDPSAAEQAGNVVGQEIQAAGVNLLLGPSLDVLDTPRPGTAGDMRTQSFGGDPFWVGQMGQAFIAGVQKGSDGRVLTVAKHFPGQGAADRRPEDEVATVEKTLQQLKQIELAPFVTVAGDDLSSPGITGAFMTSHIRYRGLQGNIRQLTPPISLAPQLGDLMAQSEFAGWRAAGGILMSDALGVPAIRRYYDPQLRNFPYRQVAQDAFLAGNDLLYLSRFALTDNWPDEYLAIRETVLFFQSQYQDDSEFRASVDASVERILAMKLRLYNGNWSAGNVLVNPSSVDTQVGQQAAVTANVARAATTLIYPGGDELADRLPSAPLKEDNILIFTDTRVQRDCADCPTSPVIGATALQDIILRLYGPNATGQVLPSHVKSLTFADLDNLLAAAPGQDTDTEKAIAAAQWIVLAALDENATEYQDSVALHNFLANRSDSLHDKRLVAIAFDAPYYLDTTDISKLTAFFGLYAPSEPFLESAVRALFREFTPTGYSPVSISGINYDLISQLGPAPGQVIDLGLAGTGGLTSNAASIQVGSKLDVQTGVILDYNGHPVPDGTPVEFDLRYPIEGLQLAPLVTTTVSGRARTTVSLDRVGELWITAQAGEAQDSATIELKISGGNMPGSIATVLPSPTTTSTPTPIPTATLTPTSEPTPTPGAASITAPGPPQRPRVALPAFLYALLGVLLASAAAFVWRARDVSDRFRIGLAQTSTQGVVAALWAAATAWVAYLLYSFGLLPGATQLQAAGSAWAAALVTLAGGLLSLTWSKYAGAGTYRSQRP